MIARQIAKSLIEKMPSPVSWEGISKEIEIKSPKTASAYIELFNLIYCTITLYSIDISGKQIKFGKNKKYTLLTRFCWKYLKNGACLTSKARKHCLQNK